MNDLLTIVLDGRADDLADDLTVDVPDDVGGMPAPVPREVEQAVRRHAERAGCLCGDGLEVRTLMLHDGPTGRNYCSPLRLHLTGCPLLAYPGSVRVTTGYVTTTED